MASRKDGGYVRLARVGRLLDGVTCARLRSGALEPTLDMLMQWLEAQHG